MLPISGIESENIDDENYVKDVLDNLSDKSYDHIDDYKDNNNNL